MTRGTLFIHLFLLFLLTGCGIFSPNLKPTGKKSYLTAAPRPEVMIETSMGEIVLELYAEESPKTVENFLKYVDDGFYNGTIFHRVLKNKVVQGGGFDEEMKEKETRETIKNESANEVRNIQGSIAMARSGDPDSASAQFFLNLANNFAFDYRDKSDPGYCVFGRILRGLNVAKRIGKVKTGDKGVYSDVPVKTVKIIRIYRL